MPSTETLEKMPPAYTEVVEFLSGGATVKEISEFRLSSEAQAQAQALLRKNKEGVLSPAEEAELNLYVELENFMSLLKVKALQQLM